MKRVIDFLRGPVFRTVFMIFALAGAIWAIAAQWREFTAALLRMSPLTIAMTVIASLAYVFVTMLSWRALLHGSGDPIPFWAASRIFFTSQVAKYLPGGVWNFVAAAEAGADHQISRRRSLVVLLTSMLVSILTGMVFTVLAVLIGPNGLREDYGWALILLPIVLILLLPPVLNRLISLGLSILKREPLDRPLGWSAFSSASTWSLLAWIVAGIQVWVIMVALGVDASPATFALATGGYALAWTVGFVVFFVPAGLGVREVVLAAVLVGYLTRGTALAVILLSRILLTIADVVWGVGAALVTAPRRSDEES